MTSSHLAWLKQADFNQLGANEYHLIENLVRQIPLPLPALPSRRSRTGSRGRRLHWRNTMQAALRNGGELSCLRHRQRRLAPLPIVVLLDISGSMERYARTLLAFLHAAPQRVALQGDRKSTRLTSRH